MNKIKKIFGEIEITWPKVIIFSIAIAIYVALINQVPLLKDTSFQDIAISFECWIFFAMIIMTNAKNPLDSALKTFVFFLISQPLIYLIEVPFLGWSIMGYYKNWIIWTILTIPMAYVGYYLKKGNWISLLILTPALLFLGYIGLNYLNTALYSFPRHILSAIFCFATMIVYVLAIIKSKKEKIIGIIANIIIIAVALIFSFSNKQTYNTILKFSDEDLLFDDSYNIYIENGGIGNVYIDKELDDYCIKGEFKKTGQTVVILEDSNGHKKYFDLNVGINTFTFNEK